LWVIATIVGLAVLLAFVLYIPLDLSLHADVYGRPKIRLRFSWLFGLVSREITGAKEKPAAKKRAAKARKKRKLGDIIAIIKLLKTKGLLGRCKQLVKDLCSLFKFRELVAEFKVGLGDPADTGLLLAIIAPAAVFLGSSHSHRISIEPSFGDDVVMHGYTHGTVRIHPIQLAPPFLKFIFSLTTIKVIWALISSKWKRKR
jgi:hypothetical protein